MSQSNLNRKRSIEGGESGDVQERTMKCKKISSYFGGGRHNGHGVGQSEEGTSSEEPVQLRYYQLTHESIQQTGEPKVVEPDISHEDDLEDEFQVNNQYQDELIDFGDDDVSINSNTKGRGKSKEKIDRQWEMSRRFKFDWA